MAAKRTKQQNYSSMLSVPPSSLDYISYQAQHPLVTVGGRFADTYSISNLDVFTAGQIPPDVLEAVWRDAVLPEIIWASMTWKSGSELAVRPILLALISGLKKVCLADASSSKAQAEGVSSSMRAQDEGASSSMKAKEEGDAAEGGELLVSAAGIDVATDEGSIQDRRISDESTESLIAGHEDSSLALGRSAVADIVCWRRRTGEMRGLAAAYPTVVKMILDGKTNGQLQDFATKGAYQMAAYAAAAIKTNAARAYNGPVLVLATSLTEVAALWLVAKGLVTIGEDGRPIKSHGQFEYAVPETELKAAVQQLRSLPGCEDMEVLAPGTYVCGTLYASKVHPFLPMPMSLPEDPEAGSVMSVLQPSGYAVLQAMLLMCAGQAAKRWTKETVAARIELWQQRKAAMQDGVVQYLTKDNWSLDTVKVKYIT